MDHFPPDILILITSNLFYKYYYSTISEFITRNSFCYLLANYILTTNVLKLNIVSTDFVDALKIILKAPSPVESICDNSIILMILFSIELENKISVTEYIFVNQNFNLLNGVFNSE